MKFLKKESKTGTITKVEASRIKVLGSGCQNCMLLTKHVEEALQQLQLDEKVEHVTDFRRIALYGAMSMPSLVVDEKVISSGKVLSVQEAKELLAGILS